MLDDSREDIRMAYISIECCQGEGLLHDCFFNKFYLQGRQIRER